MLPITIMDSIIYAKVTGTEIVKRAKVHDNARQV